MKNHKPFTFWLKRYFIDGLNGMALGLFSTLIIGMIIKNLGTWFQQEHLIAIGTQAISAMGSGIAVGVAFSLQAPILVILANCGVGLMAAHLGGPMAAFVASIIATEAGRFVSKRSPIDIIATPGISLLFGGTTALLIAPIIGTLMQILGDFILWSMDLRPILMSIIIAVSMGCILTLPISSAAIAISLSLNGEAAGAATIGCCAQMIGFAVMSFPENRWSGLLSQGLGTSMLQMPNIIKNPIIWLPPILSSAILAPIGIYFFSMHNIPAGAGMGTSGLVGQMATLEAMGNNLHTLALIAIFHFIAPALLCLLFAKIMRKHGWIKFGDLKL